MGSSPVTGAVPLQWFTCPMLQINQLVLVHPETYMYILNSYAHMSFQHARTWSDFQASMGQVQI